MRCVFFASPFGSAPYRTRSAASHTRTDAPPFARHRCLRFSAAASARSRSSRRRLPGFIATCQATSQPPVLRALVHTLVARVPHASGRCHHAAARTPCVTSAASSPSCETRFGVHPDMRLHPEVPLVSLLRSGASPDPVLPCGSSSTTARHSHPRSSPSSTGPRDARCVLISSNNPIPKPCVSSRSRKFRIGASRPAKNRSGQTRKAAH